MPDHAYELPRDRNESARLTSQHGIYKQNLGYVLHPTIATSIRPDARVVDVGAGTGAWTLDLAAERPDYTLEGLDISDAQFPDSHPANTSFRVLNILEPLPADLKGRYDVVHLRLLVCGLAGEEWNVVARRAHELLRPGGWLQWCESDFDHVEALQKESGFSREATRRFIGVFVDGLHRVGKLQEDARNLITTVGRAGFENVAQDVISSDRLPELRDQVSEVSQAAMAGIVKTLAAADKTGGMTVRDIDELDRQSRVERESGKIYWRFTMHCVTGRKPL